MGNREIVWEVFVLTLECSSSDTDWRTCRYPTGFHRTCIADGSLLVSILAGPALSVTLFMRWFILVLLPPLSFSARPYAATGS